MVVLLVGRVDVDVTAAICSIEVIITVLFELLVTDVSRTTEVTLDTDFVEVNCSDADVVFCSVEVVVSVVGRVDVDETAVICLTGVEIAVLTELLMVGLSVTTEVMFDTDFFEVNSSDGVVEFCSL